MAASVILPAEGLLIGADVGTGVHSGSPDFRRPLCFWRASPLRSESQFQRTVHARLISSRPVTASEFQRGRCHGLRQWKKRKVETGCFFGMVSRQLQKSEFSDDQVIEFAGVMHALQCAGCRCDEICFVGEVTRWWNVYASTMRNSLLSDKIAVEGLSARHERIPFEALIPLNKTSVQPKWMPLQRVLNVLQEATHEPSEVNPFRAISGRVVLLFGGCVIGAFIIATAIILGWRSRDQDLRA